MENIIEKAALLTDKDNSIACNAMNELLQASAESDEVYGFMDKFIDMLDSKNSFVRNRALLLIGANAKWDSDGIVENIIDKYLEHITDKKPITARQCVKTLPEIAEAKPELKDKILSALENADISAYADSMRPLVAKDISEASDIIKSL